MYKDKFGIPVFEENDIFQLLYQGNSDKVQDIVVDQSDSIENFRKNLSKYNDLIIKIHRDIDLSVQEFDQILQSDILVPDKYNSIDVLDFLVSRCKNDEEIQRTAEEYAEYEYRNLLWLLKYMIFLVDFMDEHNIIRGVGRGSSVSSFILYLIGVHKINPLEYELDFREFLK